MILPRLFLQNPPKRRPADAKSFSSFGFVHVFLLQDDPGDVIVNTVQVLVQVQKELLQGVNVVTCCFLMNVIILKMVISKQ